LKHIGDAPLFGRQMHFCSTTALKPDFLSESDPTGVRVQEAGDHVQDSALARAGWTKKDGDAGRDRKAEVDRKWLRVTAPAELEVHLQLR
jgi:hypothetical protein